MEIPLKPKTIANLSKFHFQRYIKLIIVFGLFHFIGPFHSLVGQTTIIDPNGDGGFENGNDFVTNGWTVVNGTLTNKWFLDTVPGSPFFMSKAGYISDNASGETWNYTNTITSVVHFYRDITLPAYETNITLEFNWQGYGELAYDALMISIAPTSYVPTASDISLGTYGLDEPATTIAQFYGNDVDTITYMVNIPGYLAQNCTASNTIRLIFTWKNDDSVGSQPPAAIDNISLVSDTLLLTNFPDSIDFQGYTGDDLNLIFPNWKESVGETIPIGSTSFWTSQSNLGSNGNITAKINLWDEFTSDWLLGPAILIPDGISHMTYKYAITDFNSLNVDPDGMQGTDDKVMIKISTDCGITWSTLFTHDSSNTDIVTNLFSTNSIPLSSYSGQEVILGIHAKDGPVINSNDYDFHIDDIFIEYTSADAVDYGNIQWPPSGAIVIGNSPLAILGQAYEPGVTESPGQAIGLEAWVGVNSTNTNPATWPSTNWTTASFNGQMGNNDEFTGNIGSGLSTGSHFYSYRYRLNNGNYKYGGYPNGFWNGTTQVNGLLTVTAPCTDPVILNTTPATRCGIGVVTLGASTNAGTLKWFLTPTSLDEVGTGATFVTPEIESTTSFYVESQILGAPISGGARISPASNSSRLPFDEGLVFDAYMDLKLNSIDIFLTDTVSGNLTITLYNNQGNALISKFFTVPIGNPSTPVQHTLDLNFVVPQGNGFRLVASSEVELVYEVDLAGFPYNLGSLGKVIFGYNYGYSNSYFYFYNWNFNTLCNSTRTEVVATVTPPPSLTLIGGLDFICPNGTSPVINISSPINNYDNYSWLPSVGVIGNPNSGYTFTALESTTFILTASQTAGDFCVNKAAYYLKIKPQPEISSISALPNDLRYCEESQLNATVINDVTKSIFFGFQNTYNSVSGTNVPGAIGDDGYVGSLPIGFTYNHGGINHTTFGVSPNGWIRLSQSGSSTSGGYINQLSDVSNTNYIAPLWDDNNTTGGTVQYLTTGSPGFRILTVQWTNMHVGGYGSSTNPTISMQIKLYEHEPKIDFIYGNTSANLELTTASIGISGPTNSTFLSITPLNPGEESIASSTIENDAISSADSLSLGRSFRFIPFTYSSFTWTPNSYLNNSNILAPLASNITQPIVYQFTAIDDHNCVDTDTIELSVVFPFDEYSINCNGGPTSYVLETIHVDSTCIPFDLTTRLATSSFQSQGSLSQFCTLDGADDDVWIKFTPKTSYTLIEVTSDMPFGYQIVINPEEIAYNSGNDIYNIIGCSDSQIRTYSLNTNIEHFIRIYSLAVDTFMNFSVCIKDVYNQNSSFCSHLPKISDGSSIDLPRFLYFENEFGSPSSYNDADSLFWLQGFNLECYNDTWTNPSYHYFKTDSSGVLKFSFENTNLTDTLLPLLVYTPYDASPALPYLISCLTEYCSYDSAIVCSLMYRIGDTVILNVVEDMYYVLVFFNVNNIADQVVFNHIENSTSNFDTSPISCYTYNISPCDNLTNLFSLNGTIAFNNLAPSSGYFTIKDNTGVSKTYNAPFPPFIDFTLENINADGLEHTISYFFSEDLSIRLDSTYMAPSPCNANPTEYYNPYFDIDTSSASGYTTGAMTISDQGGMIYQIPISLPSGTAGVAPNLSISYNSNGGDGVMGYGFTIDAMSFISRSGNSIDIDGLNLGVMLNEFDKLSVNGERLIQINSEETDGYLKSGAVYNARNQNFTRYEAIGPPGQEPNYFVALTKSGEKLFFGSTSDSKVTGINASATSFWLLKRIEDQFGNYIEYEYYINPSLLTEFYPVRIKYTGNSATTPYCFVDLLYTPRDTLSPNSGTRNYNGGMLQVSSRKLSEIRVSYMDTLIKQYMIDYDNALLSGILRVRSIQECGMNNKCFEPTVFNWESNEVHSEYTLANRQSNLIPRGKINHQNDVIIQLDVNGDGLGDVITYNVNSSIDSIRIFLNTNGSYQQMFHSKVSQFFQGINSSQIHIDHTTLLFDDLNGDNTIDVIFIHQPSGTNRITYLQTSIDRLSFDTLQFPGFANPDDIKNIGSEERQIQTSDIDGNGLPEIFVYRKSNGSNFFYARVTDPETDIDSYQKSLGSLLNLSQGDVRFIDLNGDGSAEILNGFIFGYSIQSGEYELSFEIDYLLAPLNHFFDPNDSLAAVIGTSWVEKEMLPFYQNLPPSITLNDLIFSEINGDGLPDLILRDTSGYLSSYINNGRLNFIGPSFILQSFPYIDRLPIFTDFNNDGRSDLILFDPVYGDNSWHKNMGFDDIGELTFDWFTYWNKIPPSSIAGCTPRVLSFRASSFSDVLWINECTTNPNLRGTNYWWLNDYKPSYRVNEVINGLGLRNKVIYSLTNDTTVYTPYLTSFATFPVPPQYVIFNPPIIYELTKIKPFEYTGRMPVVKEYHLDNGYNGINKLVYKYEKSVMDRSGAGFRGFSRVISKDVSSGLLTVKKYNLTTYGVLGEVENYTMFEGDSFPINRTFSVDTILPRTYNVTYTYNVPNNPLLHVNHTYETYFQFNQSSIKVNNDLDGTFASQINSHNAVDTFGNVVLNVIDYTDGFVDSLFNYYNNNTSNWHLARLSRSELKRYAPNTPPITRVSSFLYDSITGSLIKEIVEPDLSDSFRIEKTYTYNSFGNTIGSRTYFFDGDDWISRGSTSAFDTKGRFVIQEANDLGHIASFTYDNLFGHKKTITDVNGITTRLYFDDFGRSIRSEGADSSWTETQYVRCNGDCPVKAVTYTIETDALGQVSKSFYDKMGREVRSEDTGYNGHIIVTENNYNSSGYLIGTTDPYYIGETPRWTTISYDKLGREIVREETGKMVTSKKYFGLGMQVTNPLGQKRTSYTYANGKVTQTIDNQGNILALAYDAQGNVIKVTLPTGDTIVTEYDILNHNTKLIDPNMGTYVYRYNSIGEIKYQIDPRGNEVFMSYDTLGRLLIRDELEDISYFAYDTATNGIGQLAFKGNKVEEDSTEYITSYTYTYDTLSRPTGVTYHAEGDSNIYILSTEYDGLSRVKKVIYPVINGQEIRIRYLYDPLGYSSQIKDDITGTIYWELDSINSQGQTTKFTLGNGMSVERFYDIEYDWQTEIRTTNEEDSVVQQLMYDYDLLGNLKFRKDLVNNLTEYFKYDNLNRLTEATVEGQDPVQMEYDVLGNITSKSDLGEYFYNQNGEGPHVLSSVNMVAGKCLPSAQTNFTFNSFNKIVNITSTHHAMELKYSIDKQRYRQYYYFNEQIIKQKDFILDLIEREIVQGGEKTTYYIKGADGAVAVKYHLTANDSTYVHYWLKDHLGSLQTVVGTNDSIVEVLSFDAWGNRRNIDGTGMIVGVPKSFTNDRGFTGHEHLDFFDLINMNGRVYDPVLGRFTSPDPFVQEPYNIQSYNRYAYVFNNPLAYTDPSGYFGFKSFTRPFKKAIKRVVSAVKNISRGHISKGLKDISQAGIYFARGFSSTDAVNEKGAKVFGQSNWNMIVVTAATIAVSCALGPGGGYLAAGFGQAILAGAASGFVGASLGTILAGGDVNSALKAGLKGAAVGAVSAGLTYGVGSAAGSVNNPYGAFGAKVAGDGVVQGAISDYQGGSFRSAFTSSVITSGVTASLSPTTGVLGSGRVQRSMMSAAIGGVASDLSGGKFFNGAVSGGFSTLFGPSSEISEEEEFMESVGESKTPQPSSSETTQIGGGNTQAGLMSIGPDKHSQTMDYIKNLHNRPGGMSTQKCELTLYGWEIMKKQNYVQNKGGVDGLKSGSTFFKLGLYMQSGGKATRCTQY